MLLQFLKQIVREVRPSRREAAGKPGEAASQPTKILSQVRRLCEDEQYDEADDICTRRLAADPDNAIVYTACGEVATSRRDWSRAEHMFREALARKPELVEALLGLGIAYYEAGRPNDALSPLSAAVRLAPNHASSLNNYGLVLLATGNALMAGWQFRQAAKLAPNDALIQNNLGISAQYQGNLPMALKCFLRAVQLKPDYAAAHSNAGLAYRELDDPMRALEYTSRAVELDPRDPGHRINLGVIYQETSGLDDAESCFRAALNADPNSARALHGLGGVAFARNDRGAARELFLAAAEKDPGFAQAIASLGEVELAERDFEHGWTHYDYRLKAPESGIRFFPYPQWDGSPLQTGVLLVFSEQGIGDLTMFAGPLEELRTRVDHVILGCPSRAMGLFQRSYPWIEVIALDGLKLPEAIARRVTHQVPIASLMQYFRASAESFVGHHGYLVPDPERVERWKHETASSQATLTLGLSWQGGSLRTGHGQRSIPLERFAPLLRVEGVQPFSLQHFDVDAEVAAFRETTGVALFHDSAIAKDLEELTALIASLDLVVTVCSSVAHLAGALGRPCIVLAPVGASWRYLREGEKLPWYPSVRVLRQTQRDVWDDVLERAEELIRQAVADRKSHRG